MNHIILILMLLAFSLSSEACPISPFKRITLESDKFLKQADVLFFGRLDSEEVDLEGREQVAKFTIIKSYKGEVSGQVVIKNKLNSSCSRKFQVPQSTFYVFAKSTDQSGVYQIPGFATFIPLGNALEYKWSPE